MGLSQTLAAAPGVHALAASSRFVTIDLLRRALQPCLPGFHQALTSRHAIIMNPPDSRHFPRPTALPMAHSFHGSISMPFGRLKPLMALPLLACVMAGALAQNAPAPMPPRLEPLPENQQPSLGTPAPAIRPGETDNRPGTTDLRDNTGAVIETQVRTPVSTYTVRPNRQVGNAQPGDAQSVGNRAAQFKIGEFGLGRQKKQEALPQTPQSPQSLQTLEPAPMPPAMPSNVPTK